MSTIVEEKPKVTADKPERFDYASLVSRGTGIIIRRYPGDVHASMGYCGKVGSNNISGIAITDKGGLRHYDGLYHVDDPVLVEKPQLMDEDDLGVFELNDNEKLMRSLIAKQATQDELLTAMTADVSQLKASVGHLKADITRMKKIRE